MKPIEEIGLGDLVWAWDESSSQLVKRRVKRLFRRHSQPVVDVAYVTAGGSLMTIRSTTDHPFWVNQKGWIPAEKLVPGEPLKCRDEDSSASIVSVLRSGAVANVFNFEVEGAHNYFVGHAGVLVHNQSVLDPLYFSEASPLRKRDTIVDVPVTWEIPSEMRRMDREALRHVPAPGDYDGLHLERWRRGQQLVDLLPADVETPIEVGNRLLPAVITLLDGDRTTMRKGGCKQGWQNGDLFMLGNFPGRRENPFAVLTEVGASLELIEAGFLYAPPQSTHYMHTGRPNDWMQFAYTMQYAGPNATVIKPRDIALAISDLGGPDHPGLRVAGHDNLAGELGALIAIGKVAEADEHASQMLDLVWRGRYQLARAPKFSAVTPEAARGVRDGIYAGSKRGVAPVDPQVMGFVGPHLDPRNGFTLTNPLMMTDAILALRAWERPILTRSGHPDSVDHIDLQFKKWDRLARWFGDALVAISRGR